MGESARILEVNCSQCGKVFYPHGNAPRIPPVDATYECPYCHGKTRALWDKELQRELFRKELGLMSFDKRLDQLCATNQELYKKIDAFEEKLTAINNTIDSRTKEMTDALEQLLGWMKKYSPILDGVDKEYKSLIGKKGK
jgi:DNA-directed RNA polymerase subunit RPC12/RpoP